MSNFSSSDGGGYVAQTSQSLCNMTAANTFYNISVTSNTEGAVVSLSGGGIAASPTTMAIDDAPSTLYVGGLPGQLTPP